jgi:hypothetical protein
VRYRSPASGVVLIRSIAFPSNRVDLNPW